MVKYFSIACSMEERWIPAFIKMLESMSYCGRIGHTEYIGMLSDGDGDFRPSFVYDVEWDEDYKVLTIKNPSGQMTMYDAG